MVSFSSISSEAEASLFTDTEEDVDYDSDSVNASFFAPVAPPSVGIPYGSIVMSDHHSNSREPELSSGDDSDVCSLESAEINSISYVTHSMLFNGTTDSMHDGSGNALNNVDQQDELDQTDNEGYSEGLLNSYKKLWLPLEFIRFNNMNSTTFKRKQIIGGYAFKKQCKSDWRALPFLSNSMICPEDIRDGCHITAMSWSNVSGPIFCLIKMKFLKSSPNRIGHYPHNRYNESTLAFIEKITLKQADSFDVHFSLYWREHDGAGNVEATGCRTLTALRHNLLAPDSFANIITVQSELLGVYMDSNRTKYWGSTPWYDIS
ncbi:hypothetical protein M422DRAFT_265262 [Sphaerobolus stellatus SS14]|uniref:Uncharacterized protein n=1 Tax=Sphaerobolus stellatus (strain SS14) TaxID=990650 RepID=A0A0C9UUL9_SPHS4|nr:hypothetical protein M422DRAFT_265262 [Sphaerobolus stellatus SS14]